MVYVSTKISYELVAKKKKKEVASNLKLIQMSGLNASRASRFPL
jgi:hypothetical protein